MKTKPVQLSNVYFLVNKNGANFKIGVSFDPHMRIAKFIEEVGIKKSFHVSCERKRSMMIENILHRLFKESKIDMPAQDGYTEWFDISCFDEVKGFVTAYCRPQY